MRTCKKGHKYNLEYDFNGRKKGCPECSKIRSAEYHKRRKQAADFLERHRDTQAKHYKAKGNTEDARLMQRGNRLKTRYWPHLTGLEALREYEKMLAEQEYCCKICEVHQDQYDTAFHVDHCHTTERVRGLLCGVCNRYIVGGIDIRAKASKVHISKFTLVNNVLKYFIETDPEYIKYDKMREDEKK